MQIAPLTAFKIGCNVTRGDPLPSVAWHSRSSLIVTILKVIKKAKKFITNF